MAPEINNINSLRNAQATNTTSGSQLAGTNQEVTGANSVMPAKAPTNYGQVGGGGSMASNSTAGEQLNALLTAKLDDSAQQVVNSVDAAKLEDKPKGWSPWATAGTIALTTGLSFIPGVGTAAAAVVGGGLDLVQQKMENPDKDWKDLNYARAGAIALAATIPGGIGLSTGAKLATAATAKTAAKLGTEAVKQTLKYRAIQVVTPLAMGGGASAAGIDIATQMGEGKTSPFTMDWGRTLQSAATGSAASIVTGGVIRGGLKAKAHITGTPTSNRLANYGSKEYKAGQNEGFNSSLDGVKDKLANGLESAAQKVRGNASPPASGAPAAPSPAMTTNVTNQPASPRAQMIADWKQNQGIATPTSPAPGISLGSGGSTTTGAPTQALVTNPPVTTPSPRAQMMAEWQQKQVGNAAPNSTPQALVTNPPATPQSPRAQMMAEWQQKQLGNAAPKGTSEGVAPTNNLSRLNDGADKLTFQSSDRALDSGYQALGQNVYFDPKSRAFYQGKEIAGKENVLLELNKVQTTSLPDTIVNKANLQIPPAPYASQPAINTTVQVTRSPSLPTSPNGSPQLEIQSVTGQPTSIVSSVPPIKSTPPKSPSIPSVRTMPAANHVYTNINSLERYGLKALPNGSAKPQYVLGTKGEHYEIDYHGFFHNKPEFKLQLVKNPNEKLLQASESFKNSQIAL